MFEPDPIEERPVAAQIAPTEGHVSSLYDPETVGKGDIFDPPFVPVSGVYEDPDTIRKSGLAWSMGIVFFGSVAFMLFLGWLADLLVGSSPWGLVGGIVLGSIIGFVQFFRISSQMHSRPSSLPNERPLMSDHDDEGRGL